MKVQANGIPIEVEDTGEADRPAVLLVMGLGMQLIAWPEPFVQGLQAAGFRVLRFDNRDAGLSQHFPQLGVPNLLLASLKHRLGLRVRAPYTLQAMAADSLGVLAALGIRAAHVVGVSMGGMIAQRMALAAPESVLSLTSIMSSSGARRLPGPKPQVLKLLLGRPTGPGEDAQVEHTLRLLRAIGSPAFPADEDQVRQRVRAAVRRSSDPPGVLRQMVAVAADGTRARELAGLRVPTLVVHGKDDPLVPFACGHDTARRIRGARLVAIAGMGHDLPPGVVDLLLQAVVPHLRQTGGR
ncbi:MULTISPECIES: alpha/beta fold hydrolase [Ramlibacter]|uniref:Alpha/beta fold hydrolase n=1 Tax=Ramlibacter pinisoli TaxID=2682844 RepID=A0A6N8J226_9BURK|nr:MULTISPECIES: alpha/beta hydrolase [Ramlibacter]MBA2962398.1 alpha/beta hydrolase [Ramlibacter sp. CGMCC 1.13660]MVQ32340.1 alpha/beta fold hydrolase [Ramlibacter pinisoli]